MATLQTLVSFSNPNDNGTIGPLTVDSNGNLFGTTSTGGGSSDGSIFEVAYNSSTGAYASQVTTIYTFNRNNSSFTGYNPVQGLYVDAYDNLIGGTTSSVTTNSGGNNRGTIFELAKNSSTATGYDATPTQIYYGNGYSGQLVADGSGNLYGAPSIFGLARNPFNGTYSYNFIASAPGGGSQTSGLYRDATGNLFGAKTDGTVFELTYNSSTGSYANQATTISSNTGAFPSSLVKDASGSFIGVSTVGANGSGSIFKVAYDGATGTYASQATTIYNFDGTSGSAPIGTLIVDANGSLYGTTFRGGPNDAGTVFKLAKNSASSTGYDTTPTTLVTFNGTNGSNPSGTLLVDRSGNLYGTTSNGGSGSNGTVFRIADTGFAPTCYVSGTLIRTTRGEVAVEHLRVGDLAVTATGEHRSIRWIGSQTVTCARYPDPLKAWPVRIARDAFGENRPARDLYVSPEHSVAVSLVDEVLIPADRLINGATIAYAPRERVTYWHVELDSHDLLLAEGLPAESFLEMGENRAFFSGQRGINVLSAEVMARTHADFCRPFHMDGSVVAMARDRLAARADRLGWTPERGVRFTASAGGASLPVVLNGGEVTIALPSGGLGLRIVSATFVPAHNGEADPRSLGVAVYGLAVTGADGEERALDLDDPALAGAFHTGERRSNLHYRWTRGEIVVPASLLAGLTGPLLASLRFEPGTTRGWQRPEGEAVANALTSMKARLALVA